MRLGAPCFEVATAVVPHGFAVWYNDSRAGPLPLRAANARHVGGTRTPGTQPLTPAGPAGQYPAPMGVPFQDPSALEAFCLPFIEGAKRPETAEELMAARYVAYTRAAVDFLMASHDPKTRSQADRKAIESWAKGANWQGLEIVKTERGGAQDDDGTVEFIARYELDGVDHEHHENAIFRRVDGHWCFVDGQVVAKQPVRREGPKLGRNERCACGSGKKFKKCCGSAAARGA